MGIEDKRLALKRARLEAARSERPAYQPEESIGDALKGLGKNVVEGVQDYAEAASNAAPFSGLLDKSASATYAGAQEIGDLFRDPENQKDFSQRYAEDQKSRKEVADAMAKRSPIASTLGSIQGGASSLAIPAPGAGMTGVGGAATRIASNAGMAALDQGTRGEDLFDPEKAAQAATLAALIGGGVEGVTALAKPLRKGAEWVADKADELGDSFQNLAERRAFKATTGNQAAAYDQAVQRGTVNKMGRELLDSGVVGFGSKARTIADRAAKSGKEAGSEISSVLKQVDEFAPSAVSGKNIAAGIREYAGKIDSPANRGTVEKLLSQADEFEQMGNLSMKEAQRLKNTYKWDARDPATLSLGKDATNATKGLIGDEMETAISRLKQNAPTRTQSMPMQQSGTGPVDFKSIPGKPEAVFQEAQAAEGAFDPEQVLEAYKAAKSQYGTMETAKKNATKLANRQEKNRTLSLGDLIKGGVGSVLGGPTGAAVGALGGKLVRERGSSALAVTLDKAGKLLNESPQALGKYAKVLENAAQRGNTAFTATHMFLLQNDPEYRKAIGE